MTKIHNIFRDDITREINPVVKVQDENLTHIRQELQEYVITEQIRGALQKGFQKLPSRYQILLLDFRMVWFW